MTICAIMSSQAVSLVNFRGPLIRALVAANIRVKALAPDFDEDSSNSVRELGAEPIEFNLSRTGMNPFRELLDVVYLSRLLRKLRPDISFGYVVKPVIYGTIAAWVARVPLRVTMITGLGFVFTDSGYKLSFRRRLLLWIVERLYRASLKGAHVVIFQNEDDMHEFINRGMIGTNKAVCIRGTGIDLDEWPQAPSLTEPITFTLAARLLREKGIVEYVQAAERVKLKYPSTRFFLLGKLDSNPGSLSQNELDSWVQSGYIEWPGHVQMQPWLKQTSVYVLPSYREGVPRSTQEAMAMARPIITTDVPGCRETVIEGKNGFLVPVRDVSALAEAMIRFIENPELIKSMGLESRKLAEARFNVEEINAQILSVMRINQAGD